MTVKSAMPEIGLQSVIPVHCAMTIPANHIQTVPTAAIKRAWPVDPSEIVARAAMNDRSYAYCQTRGLPQTREFLAARLNARGGVQITADDILFFNGLGDAISKVYALLRREARVIGPSPSYPTHSSAEASHAGAPPITYRLVPEQGWMPDLDELRNRIKYNDSIAGLMVTNPDNPTGAVYPKHVLQEMVRIAREFDLFIIADEIYTNMVFDRSDYAPLSDLIEDVPAIALKGISKEVPWPGSRCGWMEVYNQERSPMFQRYVRSMLDAKMLEVCSTTLPQMVIPEILGDPRYPEWQEERTSRFARRARRATAIMRECPGVIVNEPRGAFYFSVVFERDVTDRMSLAIEDPRVAQCIEKRCVPGIAADKKFCYQLLGAKGICVVPLTSFMSNIRGFRSTVLETDDVTFEWVYRTLADAVTEFTQSA